MPNFHRELISHRLTQIKKQGKNGSHTKAQRAQRKEKQKYMLKAKGKRRVSHKDTEYTEKNKNIDKKRKAKERH